MCTHIASFGPFFRRMLLVGGTACTRVDCIRLAKCVERQIGDEKLQYERLFA